MSPQGWFSSDSVSPVTASLERKEKGVEGGAEIRRRKHRIFGPELKGQ